LGPIPNPQSPLLKIHDSFFEINTFIYAFKILLIKINNILVYCLTKYL
jgi:hypothetical protein